MWYYEAQAKKVFRIFVWSLGVTSALLAHLPAFSKQRSVAAIRRNLSDLKPEARNGAYLDRLNRVDASERSLALHEAVFSKEVIDELKVRFDAFDHTFQRREIYGLNNINDYQLYEQSTKGLADWTMQRLVQFHIENTLRENFEKSLKKVAIKEGTSRYTRKSLAEIKRQNKSKMESAKSSGSANPQVVQSGDDDASAGQKAAQAVIAVANLQRALQNTTLNFGGNTQTRLRYDLPSGLMRMALTSPLVDANLDYQLIGLRQTLSGQSPQSERLSFGISRNFTELTAQMSVRYGLLSESINYNVSKQLVGPLSAQFERSQFFSSRGISESFLRLNLWISF